MAGGPWLGPRCVRLCDAGAHARPATRITGHTVGSVGRTAALVDRDGAFNGSCYRFGGISAKAVGGRRCHPFGFRASYGWRTTSPGRCTRTCSRSSREAVCRCGCAYQSGPLDNDWLTWRSLLPADGIAIMPAVWRDDIDALCFDAPNGSSCCVHRLAFRCLIGRNPTSEDCLSFFGANRVGFVKAAAKSAAPRQRSFHINSRQIRQALGIIESGSKLG